ncbi:MAG: BBP7 family outer membrane beta-barrel protein [Verrucomicrobia bacterium]|nr:BBP7 family outer membrane beta-barrel protein [Verrucomicrobiota bacterium]
MRKYLLLMVVFIRSAVAQEPPVWIKTDYLLCWIKNNPVPVPLVTEASLDDTLPGAIGQPHPHVVLGKKSISMDLMQGFQVDAGGWIKSEVGIEGSYFLLSTASRSKSITTSGEPGSHNYAVPIFDPTGVFGLKGKAGETIFILPGPLEGPGFFGQFQLQLRSRLQGVELSGLYRLINKESFQLRLLGGFFWFQLHEKLFLKAETHAAPGASFGHAFYNTADRFHTTNNFLAGQFKIDTRYQTHKWYLQAALQGALGAMLQEAKIKGSSETSGGNLFFLTKGTASKVLPGGIFAEPSNSGTHQRNPMAWGFETKIRTGFEITKNIDVHLGYTFLWLSKVLRPGDQIDRKINSTGTALANASRATVGTGPGPIPPDGPAAPAPAPTGPKRPKDRFKSATFWVQGLDFGIQFNF